MAIKELHLGGVLYLDCILHIPSCQRIAKHELVSVVAVREDDAARHAIMERALDHFQRQTPLWLISYLIWNVRTATALSIFGPRLRNVEPKVGSNVRIFRRYH